MLIQNKIHVSTAKEKCHTGNKDNSSHLQNRCTVCQQLLTGKESWLGKLFNMSFEGRYSKMWRFNIDELCMSAEVNFFKGFGENDTGTHTVLVVRV